MAGVRTPSDSLSSVLVDSDDTLPSIFSSDMAIGLYVARRAGIGINAGRIQVINSKLEEVRYNTQEWFQEVPTNCEMLYTEWCAWR